MGNDASPPKSALVASRVDSLGAGIYAYPLPYCCATAVCAFTERTSGREMESAAEKEKTEV
jgi:hypothetical protein